MGETFSRNGVTIHHWDSLDLYDTWETPVVIISDGAYGIKGFPGDPPTPDGLGAWYEPHIAAWSQKATPQTTLWFWNTEIGWANVHPVLVKHGWVYRNCHIWDKGMAHVAGNSNTQSLRKLPVVSEVCVQYVKEATFRARDGRPLPMKEWLRAEWERTGLPLYKTNEAAGVKNAATRKYFTKDHLWYYPPVDVFTKLVAYANRHGDPSGRPYFSLDGNGAVDAESWERMRAKFHCDLGITNVWREPPLHGKERLKTGAKCVHLNQKPLRLIELIIRISSDSGDIVWEPFGGLCSGAIASYRLGRRCRSAEINKEYYDIAVDRLAATSKDRSARKLEAF